MSVAKEQTARKPRKRRSDSDSPKVQFSDYVFTDLRFTGDEQADCEEWLTTNPDPVHALRELATHGVKISFSTMNDGTTNICSYTITDSGLPDAGCVVTAFADDPVKAFLVLCYKLDVLVGTASIAETADSRKRKRSTIG